MADLHLGYVWSQRRAGQLLPLSAPANTLERLLDLRRSYPAKELILLGDVVHRALALPAIADELRCLLDGLRPLCRLRLLAGNHDRDLQMLLAKLQLPETLENAVGVGPHWLLHGDEPPGGPDSAGSPEPAAGGLIVMGHEHPAIRLGDGIGPSAKCPCFLVGRRVLVLPAFSDWAAGVAVGGNQLMSGIARAESFTHAVAVLGDKLVPVALKGRR